MLYNGTDGQLVYHITRIMTKGDTPQAKPAPTENVGEEKVEETEKTPA